MKIGTSGERERERVFYYFFVTCYGIALKVIKYTQIILILFLKVRSCIKHSVTEKVNINADSVVRCNSLQLLISFI